MGSRGSPLALAQTRLVHDAIEREGQASRIVIIETDGDRRAPDNAWGEGAFVAAIERALLAGRVDIAVHSAKDVPIDEDPRLRIAAYLPRADPRDALVVRIEAEDRRLDDLPPGSRVGTDSPRRAGFLLARRPDLKVHPLHGNIDTRLRRLDAGETDALVVACAGLDRMGLGSRIAERLEPEVVPPAPGQGAIAVQIRRDDARMLALAKTIDHRRTRLGVEVERSFLEASGGGCRAPIGALAELDGGELVLLGGHARPDGSSTAIACRRGPASGASILARELAHALARDLMKDASTPRATTAVTGDRPRVLVTRAAQQAGELVSALRDAGLDPVPVPTIAIEFEPSPGGLDTAAHRFHAYAWVVITSANGARAIIRIAERMSIELEAPSWAAIGPATRRVLEQEGIVVDFQPSASSGSAMALELPVRRGDRMLIVRGDIADEDVAASLRVRGAEVDDVVAYRTRQGPETSRPLLREAFAEGTISAVVFTSGSTIGGLVALAEAESLDLRSIPAVCIGPATAKSARAAGFRVAAVSVSPEASALAAAAAEAILKQPVEVP